MESQLVHKTQRHASVLKHVVKGQMLDGVLGAVDVGVRILKGRLDDKGRGVAGLGGRGVVRAGVAALGLDPRDMAVLAIQCQQQFERRRMGGNLPPQSRS